MKYSEIRGNIKSGDLVAYSHKGWGTISDWLAQAIRFFTRSQFSHIGVVWKVGERVLLLEAVKPAVRVFPLSWSKDFYLIPLNVTWNDKTEVLALSKLGQRYSTWDAIKAFFRVSIGKNMGWECAEYAHLIVTSMGVNLGNTLTPASLVEHAVESGNPIIYVTRDM